MGRVGYEGVYDYRLEQLNQEEVIERFEDEHSGLFKSPKAIEYFLNKVINLIGD